MGTNPKEPPELYIPEPKGDAEKPGKQGAVSPAEKMRRAYYEGVEVEAFRKGAGLMEQKQQPANADMQQMMTTTMQSYSNALTSLVQELVKAQTLSMQSKQPADQSEFFKYLIGEVKDMKQKVDGGQGNPFELIDEYHTRMTKWQDDIQKRTSAAQPGGLTAGGNIDSLRIALEVEKLRIEAAERQRMHEEKMTEQKRAWEKEDRRWEQEFLLKRDEAKASQDRSDTTMATLKTLAVSLVDSIDTSTGIGQQPLPASAPLAQQAPPVEQGLAQNQFPCEKCGAVVTVVEGATSVDCPSCKTHYGDNK